MDVWLREEVGLFRRLNADKVLQTTGAGVPLVDFELPSRADDSSLDILENFTLILSDFAVRFRLPGIDL